MAEQFTDEQVFGFASRTLEVPGATLNVVHSGDPNSGSPRLLIQGLGCEARTIWTPLLVELQQRGDARQHLAFDTRGIGGSSGWPSSLEEMADDAASVLAQNCDVRAEVVGHSLGGAVAMLLAARHPGLVKALVLMDIVPEYNQKTKSGFLWRAEQIRTANNVEVIFDTVITRSFGNDAHANRPETIAIFKAMLARQSPETYAHICELAAANNTWDAFHAITVPTLFISGSEDVSTSPSAMVSLARRLGDDFIEIRRAGHNPPLEQPAAVADILQSWSHTNES